ncbi:MAG: Gmad2 immunoglobulin-like domain-containing protein [Thermoleophilia bacterium]|nr:Gmad2 immunoglobulin-like domain-containing protein [Thermoleophilia bacterium]
MNLRTRTVVALLLLLAAAALLLAGCGSDSSSDSKSSSTTTTEAATSGDDDQPGGDDLLPIVVESPKPFASVYRSFTLSGTAVANEGTLRWQILDASGKPLAQGTITASCGGPCRGDFSTKVNVAKVTPGSWELHVFEPPTADDDPARRNDTIVPITITTGPIDSSDPAADAPPPGGVPANGTGA